MFMCVDMLVYVSRSKQRCVCMCMCDCQCQSHFLCSDTKQIFKLQIMLMIFIYVFTLSLSTLSFSLLFSFAMFCMLFFYLLNGNIRQHNSIIVGMSMGMSVDLYYSSTVSFRLSFLFLSMSVCVCK